ncbi:TPA: DNA-directed RNA polymerase subunit beta', partial [Candidatus Falkowbacteria bacterium]|nr:DNA-directed RNA polymerase subunit beta' [Candidatus Falkowbacteria bacterium]
DFDGDQMAVHVPLTEEAKSEAKNLMLATHNLLKPATGNPITTPTMDMVWGSYYVTLMDEKTSNVKNFTDIEEAKLAYALRKITLRDKVRIRVTDEPKIRAKLKEDVVETCLGRILFNELLPEKLPFYNEVIDKKKMGSIVKLCLEHYDFDEVAVVLDKIKEFGFKQLTKSGFSWGMDDTPEVTKKKELVEEGNQKIEQINEQYEMGLLTPDERYTKVIETWTDIKDRVTEQTKGALNQDGPVYTMINAGARGSWGQLTQMMGMKGLVTNPAGQIIELPVKANFREGFNVLEYYISSHGSRKGLTDTALRTANAGYLTRRLVDVAQDVIVVQEDCGDTDGKLFTKTDSESMNQTLVDRIVGRFVMAEIKNPKTGKAVVKKGGIITQDVARELEPLDIQEARVRSVLTCKLPRGVCRKCYGYDLAYNELVKMGTSVGIIAAQSIGEPGTQLTMRTFHTGGVAGGDDITQGLPRVEEIFEARTPKKKALLSEVGGKVSVTQPERTIKGPKGDIIAKSSFGEKIVTVSYEDNEDEVHKLDQVEKIKVKDGETVNDGSTLYINHEGKKIKAKKSGSVSLDDKELTVSGKVEKQQQYVIPAGTVLYVKDGETIEKGAQLTEGSLDLDQLYKLRGREAVEEYILKEIQYIYKSQGQPLNDKHVEIVTKQMFSRVYVVDSGDTNLLEGEIVEYSELIEENDKAKAEKGKQAISDQVFLGISKVSLSTKSFLAAASFQETARVLINAAVTGKVDKLEGLKENVIIGRLIPAGTGYKINQMIEKGEPVDEIQPETAVEEK